MKVRKVKAADIAVVVLVVAASVVTMVMIARARTGEKGSTAIIEVNGKESRRVKLGQNQSRTRITVKGLHGTSTVEFYKGRVHMLKSTCRDKICIGMGWVDVPGESIVCLPNRVVIRVLGSGKNKVDTVTE
jgi:hypothetical protein